MTYGRMGMLFNGPQSGQMPQAAPNYMHRPTSSFQMPQRSFMGGWGGASQGGYGTPGFANQSQRYGWPEPQQWSPQSFGGMAASPQWGRPPQMGPALGQAMRSSMGTPTSSQHGANVQSLAAINPAAAWGYVAAHPGSDAARGLSANFINNASNNNRTTFEGQQALGRLIGTPEQIATMNRYHAAGVK